MSRHDQYNVTLTVGGINLGTWDKMTGGELDSDETKYRPGAMAAQISLGGPVNPQNVTVSRLYRLDRDHPQAGTLLNAVGKKQAVAVKQPLDVDGNAVGRPITYTGLVKKVTLPDADSTSNDASMVEVEISTSSIIPS